MKPNLRLVSLNSIPILQQLQWEEALLRADQHNWCLINQGSPPAIVMGISGNANQLICQEKWERKPIPLIRRFSGGGTVVIDENTLFVTLICQAEALSIPSFPRPLMQWTADKLYSPLFRSSLFQLQENDYVLDGRKWGGNAQSIIKGRWLHHSSLLWDYHSDYMEYLCIPPKMPAYRERRSHDEFLCRLKDYWSSADAFRQKLIEQLADIFCVEERSKFELDEILNYPHRKVTRVEKTCREGLATARSTQFIQVGPLPKA